MLIMQICCEKLMPDCYSSALTLPGYFIECFTVNS